MSYRYHLAVSPYDGKVYISDPEAHQILLLRETDNVQNPADNVYPIVGNGLRCLQGDRSKCGDGDLAIRARLTYPKGMNYLF